MKRTMLEIEQFLRQAKQCNVVPVIDAMPADLLTPLSVYLKLSKGQKNSFLLESVEGGETLARYSFIGAGPEMIVNGNDAAITCTRGNVVEDRSVSMIAFLREHFAKFTVPQESELPSFVGGAIGYLGFSCSEWFEPSLKRDTAKGDEAEAAFMFYRSIIAFDHAKQLIQIVSLVFVDETAGTEEAWQEAFEQAKLTNRKLRSILETGPLEIPIEEKNGDRVETLSNWDKKDFEIGVNQIKELIAAGECYQVVLSQCFSKPTTASPVSIYRAIRSLNPSPYMFLLCFDEKSVIGASPEMLVRCRGRQLEYRPIAGTRPRGKDSKEDAELAIEMAADKKEVAEHLMLVDLGRNDLGRVAEYGSVKVSGLMSVEKYSHVQHLVSYLSADLSEGKDRFDALASCFPAGTVSGAPKVRAVELIREMEPTPRGVYAGAVGYFDYAGNMDTCITIRTLVLENGLAKVQAGAGIVADSVPELEYQETMNKAAALLKAVEIAEGAAL